MFDLRFEGISGERDLPKKMWEEIDREMRLIVRDKFTVIIVVLFHFYTCFLGGAI